MVRGGEHNNDGSISDHSMRGTHPRNAWLVRTIVWCLPLLIPVYGAYAQGGASIAVITPNGGESYARGSVYPITWTSTGTIGANVRIIARKGAASGGIVASTPNDGSFDWTVPANFPLGTNYIVEIASVDNPSIIDVSNANFSLVDVAPPAGTITVLSPNGGENYQRGNVVPLTWSSTGTVGTNVAIVLNKGASLAATLSASTPNDGAFDWTIPVGTALGSDYTIAITSVTTPTIGDSSNGFFSVSDVNPPVASITVLTPNGGESYVRGSVQNITWTSTGAVGANVRILARRGTGSGGIAASTPNDGSFSWTVPASYPLGTNYTIEISSIDTPAITDISNANFSLVDVAPPAGTITIVSPNGGENYLRGNVVPLSWTSTGTVGANVSITLNKNGALASTLSASTPNDGAFDWTVPTDIALGTDYAIAITSVSLPAIGDSSNAFFTLSDATPPAASITVLTPNGGENYVRGSVQNITWSSTGAVGANVKILARRGSGSGGIAASTPNDGSYSWTVPTSFPLGTNYTIQIQSITLPAVLDNSDSTFSLTDHTPPTADFDWAPALAAIGEAVQFTDASQAGSSAITQWQWNFGDGSGSTAQHPTHAYTNGGSFDVTLTVTSAGGSNAITQQVAIAHTPPVVGFDVSHRVIRQGETLSCFNLTEGGSAPIAGWVWNFGDGETSPDEEASHVYDAPGHYTISLTALSDAGEVTETKVGHVMVLEPGSPVMISEFVASNHTGLQDEDGKFSDWIELYNAGDEPVSLLGWALTDDPLNPAKWLLPDVVIEPADYLIVFASGENRSAVPGELHTNFKLDADGEYVALVEDPSVPLVAHDYEAREQRTDVSFGLVGVDAGMVEPAIYSFMNEPTPGALNAFDSAQPDATTEPILSHIHGHYASAFSLTLTGTEAGAAIYYTLNGSLPSQVNGTLYQGPISVVTNTALRAIAYAPGRIGSKVVTATFIIGENAVRRSLPALCVVGDRQKDLWGPDGIMVVNGGYFDGFGNWIPLAEGDFNSFQQHGRAWERNISLEFFDPNGAPFSPERIGFQQDAGIRIQGSRGRRNSYRVAPSTTNPWTLYQHKISFSYYFRDEYGLPRLEYPLIPNGNLSSIKDVVMRAGNDDQVNPFIKDEMSRRLMDQMGNLSSMGGFVHFYLNGYFKGYYNPVERYTEDFFQHAYDSDTGWDIIKGTDEADNDRRELEEGDWEAWFALNDFARDHDLTDPAHYATISSMLDIDNFIDYLILQTYAANFDWPRNNWVMARERSADPDLSRWRYYVWDTEMSYYSINDTAEDFTVESYTDNPFHLQDGWTFLRAPGTNRDTSPTAKLYQALRLNPDFQAAWTARANVLLAPDGILGTDNVQATYNALSSQVSGVLLTQPLNTFIHDVWAVERPAWLRYWFGQESLMPVVPPPAP